MAQRIHTYDFKVHRRRPARARRTNYPWDEWLDGSIWRLARGEDFDAKPATMEAVVRTTATRRGVKVRVVHDDHAVVLQRRLLPPRPESPLPDRLAPVLE
jgi:hypothetical protein